MLHTMHDSELMRRDTLAGAGFMFVTDLFYHGSVSVYKTRIKEK